MLNEAKPKRLRSSVVCVHEQKLLVVRLRDPVTQLIYLFPPGGSIEAGETPAQAAEREALEETQTKVAIDPVSELVVPYDFTWKGRTIDCKTHFFRAHFIAHVPEQEILEEDWVGSDWIPLQDIDSAFHYHAAIRGAIKKLIQP